MFYLYMTQHGEGCDYTIGCGTKLTHLAAETRAEAIPKAMKAVKDHGLQIISRAQLIEVASLEDMPLDQWMEDEREQAARAASVRSDAEARATYEKLKARFGA